MSDEFSIVVNYKNGMVFRMGNWNDVNYKLELASNVMSDDSVKGKKGYLTMAGANQCSFRMNKTGDKLITPEQPTTEPKTDANGKPIDGESNPEQEAIFEHYNQNRPADQQQQQQDPQPQPGQNGGNDNNAYNNNNEYNNGYGNDGGNAYGNNDYADGYNNGYGNDYGGYDANGGYGGADYGNGYGGGYDQYVGGGQNY
jgi:cell division protein FtsQ